MRILFIISALATLFTISLTAQKGYNCPSDECAYQPGEKAYLFGNDVKLRSGPGIESEVLELLKIGEWVEIIEKTNFSWPYKGFDSPFYKVKYDKVTGYILGGLLSFQKKTLNEHHYYFAYSKEGKTTYLNIRNVKNGAYIEKKVPLAHPNIDIKILDGKGLSGVDGMFYVDYYAEACGLENGGIYFFAHGDELTKVATLSQISDSGILQYSEKFIFPEDEGGIPEKILFKKERNEVYDESTNWSKIAKEKRELSWVNGKLIPDYKQKASN